MLLLFYLRKSNAQNENGYSCRVGVGAKGIFDSELNRFNSSFYSLLTSQQEHNRTEFKWKHFDVKNAYKFAVTRHIFPMSKNKWQNCTERNYFFIHNLCAEQFEWILCGKNWNWHILSTVCEWFIALIESHFETTMNIAFYRVFCGRGVKLCELYVAYLFAKHLQLIRNCERTIQLIILFESQIALQLNEVQRFH